LSCSILVHGARVFVRTYGFRGFFERISGARAVVALARAASFSLAIFRTAASTSARTESDDADDGDVVVACFSLFGRSSFVIGDGASASAA
jgi:hypothetical protein